MLGYIVPYKSELRIREFDLYSGYYCGLCKSVANRFGQLPRLVLNYDSVLLALVLSSLFTEKEALATERCPVHPRKKKLIVKSAEGLDYAADMMVLLAFYKLQDDHLDEGGWKSQAGMLALRRSHRRLLTTYPKKGAILQEQLDELHLLEREKCTSLDRASEPFAKIMSEIFSAEELPFSRETIESLRRFGYHLGKWIYLIDAYDDLSENEKDGAYNPLLPVRPGLLERMEFNLHCHLTELSSAWQSLAPQKNLELIENIVYMGLFQKTEQILEKGKQKDAESI